MASMRSVGVRLRLFVDQYKRDAEEARKANESVGKGGKKAKADLDQLAGTLTIVGGLLTAAAGAAVFAAATFDKQMSEVKAVAGATEEEFQALREAAIEAGAATSFSAREAAQAEAELAKAGLTAADILGGALSGSLSLAAAGTLSLETAATIAANAMNMFGLEGKDVGHIADVLAAAANKSAVGVEDLGLGLQQVGLVADQVGFSLEETVGLLAAFGDVGLRGSDGATSLKTALLRLAAPTGKAKELMEQLGISLYDSSGNMVDAVTIAGQLETGMADLSNEQRNAALNTIFGADAIRAANVMYGLGAEGVQEYINAVDQQGAAADVAATKMDNLAGDVEELTGSLETLFIQSGSGASGGLRTLTQGVTNVVNAVGSLPPAVQSTATVVAGLTGVVLLGAAAAIKAHSGFSRMLESLTDMGPAGKRAAGGLRAVGGAAGVAGAAFTAALIAGQVVDAMIEDELNPNLEALAKGLEFWRAGAKLSGESARVLGDDFGELDHSLAVLSQSPHWVTGLMGQLQAFGAQGITDIEGMTARVESFDATLAGLVQGGNMQQANDLFDLQAAKFEAAGIPIEKLRDLLPQYSGALEVATKEQEQAASSTEHLERAQLAAVEAGEKLIDVWNILHGAAVSLDEEMLDAVQSIQGVTAAFEENGSALEGNTEAALENRLALADAAVQAIEAADAFIENGGSAAEAEAMLDDFREQAINAAVAAGGNADEVRRLADELFRLPEKRTVSVNVLYSTVATGPFGYGRGGRVMRDGGIVTAAAGRLQATTVASPTVLFGERETEQEAFVPKRGNFSRSMNILSQAAGWYGADVVPRGTFASGGGSSMVDVRVSIGGSDSQVKRAVADLLRVDVVRDGGGSVQARYGQRGRVG